MATENWWDEAEDLGDASAFTNATTSADAGVDTSWLDEAEDLGPVEAAPARRPSLISTEAPTLESLGVELPKPPPPPESILRQAADIPVQFAIGVNNSIKGLTDLFGADNPVSQNLSQNVDWYRSILSASAKEDEAEVARIMEAAENEGIGGQLMAGLKAFTVAPVDFISSGLGSLATFAIGGAAARAAGLGMRGIQAVQAGMGAGMGAGIAKGEIYQSVKDEMISQGKTEEEARKVAMEAQSFNGKNLDQILLAAGLGAASAYTGAESIISKILTKGGIAPTASRIGNVLKGGLTEGVPEFAQAAQEAVASNLALQREGVDVPLTQGVFARGALEGLAGVALGAGAGAIEPRVAPPTTQEVNAAASETKDVARQNMDVAPATASLVERQAETFSVNATVTPRREGETDQEWRARTERERAETPEQRVTRLQEEARAATEIELEEEPEVAVEPPATVTPPVATTPEGAVAPVEPVVTPEVAEPQPAAEVAPAEPVAPKRFKYQEYSETAEDGSYSYEGYESDNPQQLENWLSGYGVNKEEVPATNNFAILKNMFVEEEARGQGNGSSMLEDFLSNTQDADSIFLVADKNEEQVAGFDLVDFYKGYGFEVVKDTPEGPLMVLKQKEVSPAVAPPAEVAPEVIPTPETPNLEPLRRVARAEQTPEDVPSLVEAGLVEVYKDQPVITEAGIAQLPETERPRLTPEARKIQIDTGATDAAAEAILKGLRIGVDQVPFDVKMPAGWTLVEDIYVPPAPQEIGEEVTVYRGELPSLEGGRQLAGIRDFGELVGLPDDVALAPFTYYSTSEQDAMAYLERDARILKDYQDRFGEEEGMKMFQSLHGFDPRTEGQVVSKKIRPRKVFDITEMGTTADFSKMYELVAKEMGYTLPENWRWKDVPKEVADEVNRYGLDIVGDPDDKQPTWQYFRNDMDRTRAALIQRGLSERTKEDVRGSLFAQWLRKNGYDAVAMMHDTETGPVKHILVINEDAAKAQENLVPQANRITAFLDAAPSEGLKYFRPATEEALRWEGGIYPTISNESGTVKVALDRTDIFERKSGEVWRGDPTAPPPNTYIIQAVVTSPEVRGTGEASAVMQRIINMADKSGLTLKLEPVPMKSFIQRGQKAMTKKQLVDWYKRLGFTQAKEGSDAILVREPSPAPEVRDQQQYNRLRSQIQQYNERTQRIARSIQSPEYGTTTEQRIKSLHSFRSALVGRYVAAMEKRGITVEEISQDEAVSEAGLRPSVAWVDANGRVGITFGNQELRNIAEQTSDGNGARSAVVQSVEEEIIHAIHNQYMLRDWDGRGNAEEYLRVQAGSGLSAAFKELGMKRATEVFGASWRAYFKQDMASNEQMVDAIVKNPINALSVWGESVRQLVELRENGEIGESTFRRVVNSFNDFFRQIVESVTQFFASPEYRGTSLKNDVDAIANTFREVIGQTEVRESRREPAPLTQQDREYLDAVERGDLDAASRMVEDAARKVGATVHTPSLDVVGVDRESIKQRIESLTEGEVTDAILDEAIEFVNSLPDTMLVYRAVKADNRESVDVEMAGESWTIDGPTAYRFGTHNGSNFVIVGQVNKSDMALSDMVSLYVEFSSAYDADSEFEIKIPRDWDVVKNKHVITSRQARSRPYFSMRAYDFGGQIKSADPVTYDDQGNIIPLSQRFQPEQADIRYSYAGVRAQTPQFMRDSLSVAQAMAAKGEDAEAIRSVTGWIVNPYDGKLRWEIPDNNVSFTKNIDSTKPYLTLGEVLNHDAFFEAYPDAKNILFQKVLLKNNIGAYFDPQRNKITLNSSMSNTEQLSSTLHEIQHWIQKREGFAQGSSPEEFIYDASFQLSEDSQKKVDELELEKTKLRKEESELNDYFRSLDDYQKGVGKNVKEARRLDEISYKIRDINDAISKIITPEKSRFALEKYVRTAGEIESRDVQARMKMTPEQRKATAPYSSENISPEDAVIMGGEGGVAELRGRRVQMGRAGMETSAVEARLQELGFPTGGIIRVVNEPDADFEGRTIILDGKVVGIELNAAALKDDAAVERVLNHEIAESANADGALNRLVAGLTPKERKEINDAITRLGYSERARTAEEAARAVELLAEGWRGRRWFERAVARIEAWANKLGYKLTRRAAEYIAARNVSEINAEFKQAYNKFVDKKTGDEARYSYAGVAANVPQFMRDSLSAAQAMAAKGEDANTIRLSTGWILNPYDKKLRWEIPDKNIKLAITKEFRDKFYEPYGWGTGDFDVVESIRNLAKNKSKTIRDGVEKFYKDEKYRKDEKYIPLMFLVNHPQLFKAYPDLAFAEVSFNPNDTKDWKGSQMAAFMPSSDRIIISGSNLAMALSAGAYQDISGGMRQRLLRNVMHEIQHWIQKKEGFASGASPKTAKNAKDTQIAAQMALGIKSWMRSPASKNLSIDEIQRTTSDPTRKDLWPMAKQLVSKPDRELRDLASKKSIGFEGYRRVAGEIEARDVEARMGLTESQRKYLEPYSSQNIDPDDAIIMGLGEGGVASEIRESRREDAIPTFSEGSPEASTLSTMQASMAKVDAASEAKPNPENKPTYKISEIASVWMDQGGDARQLQDMVVEYTNLTPANAKKVANAIAKQYGLQQRIAETGAVIAEPAPEVEGAPRKTSVQRLIEQAVGVRRPIVKLEVNEKSALKEQIRLKAREARETRKARKEAARELAEAVTQYVKDNQIRGPVRARQTISLAKQALKLDVNNEKAVDRYIMYVERVVENANYDKDLSDAKALRKRAKEMAKKKNIGPEQKKVLEAIGNINPSLLDNPFEYNVLTERYLLGFLPVTSRRYSVMPDAEARQYLESLEEQMTRNQAELNRAELERFFEAQAGFAEQRGLSLEEAQNLLNEDGDIAPIIQDYDLEKRKATEEMLLNLAQNAQRTLKTYDDSANTARQKELISFMQKVKLESITSDEKKRFIRFANNILANGETFGVEQFEAVAKAQERLVEAAKDKRLAQKMNAWIGPLSGGSPAELVQKLSLITQSEVDTLKNIFGREAVGVFRRVLGLLDLDVAQTASTTAKEKVANKVGDFYKKLKKKYGEESVGRESNIFTTAAAYFIQAEGNKTQEESIAYRRRLWTENIEELRKSERREDREEAEIKQRALDAITGNSNAEILNSLRSINPAAYEQLMWWKDQMHPEYKPFLKDHVENFRNQANNYDNVDYLSIHYKWDQSPELPSDLETQEFDDPVSFRIKQAANSIKRKDHPSLPVNPKTRVKANIDVNFGYNQYNSLTEQIEKAYTAPAWEAVSAFVRDPLFEQVVGGKTNADFVKNILRNIKATRTRKAMLDDENQIIGGTVALTRRISTQATLGGLTQPLRQVPDQLFKLFATTGRWDLISRNIVDSLLNYSSVRNNPLLNKLPIGRRGDARAGSQFAAEFNELARKVEASVTNKQWTRYKELMTQMGEFWMTPLRGSDTWIAKVSWMSYYEAELNKRDIKMESWDREAELFETDPARQEAAAQAEYLVDFYAGASDPTKMAALSKQGNNGWREFSKLIFLSLNSFALQQKSALMSDFRDLILRSGSRQAALAGITGTIGGMVAFHGMRIFIIGGLLYPAAMMVLKGIFGIDMDEPDEEEQEKQLKDNWRKMKASIYSNIVAGGAGQFLEGKSIDAFNRTMYLWDAHINPDEMMDDKGEFISFSKYEKEKSPFYRFRSYDKSEFTFGLADVLTEQAQRSVDQTAQLLSDEEMSVYTGNEQAYALFATGVEWAYFFRLMDTDLKRITTKLKNDIDKQAKEREAELRAIRNR